MEEFETLSDGEKAVSIRSKIKNIQYNKYNIELDILTENAISEPDTNKLEEWNRQLSDLNLKEAALHEQLQVLVS